MEFLFRIQVNFFFILFLFYSQFLSVLFICFLAVKCSQPHDIRNSVIKSSILHLMQAVVRTRCTFAKHCLIFFRSFVFINETTTWWWPNCDWHKNANKWRKAAVTANCQRNWMPTFHLDGVSCVVASIKAAATAVAAAADSYLTASF